MDQYIGGIEHAVLHLLYARFWTKVMRDMGLVKCDEPFTQAVHAGHAAGGVLLPRGRERAADAGSTRRKSTSRTTTRAGPPARSRLDDSQPVMFGGIEKMSKSKNNVVEPRDIIERFGADTARAYVMFAGPPAGERRVVGFRRGRRASLPAPAVDHVRAAAG